MKAKPPAYIPDSTHPGDWFVRQPRVARTVDDLRRLSTEAPNCESLRVVDFRREDDLREIEHLHHLRELEFTSCPISPDLIERIGRYTSLAGLYLAESPDVNEGLLRAVSSCMPLLEHLVLYLCYSLDDRGVSLLAPLTHLRSLRLDHTTSLTDVGASVLADLPALGALSLHGCYRLSDTTLDTLRRCPSLEILTLPDGASFGEAALRHLFGNRSRLRRVSMSELDNVTDIVLAALADCELIEYLYLFGCRSVTDSGIRSLGRLKNLKGLVVRLCRNVSAESVAALRAGRSNAEFVHEPFS